MPRIESLNPFARPSEKREVNKKYFFALEGKCTEKNYIKELLLINKIESVAYLFYRSCKEKDSSNLLNISNLIEDIINKKQNIEITFDVLCNYIHDLFTSKRIIINKAKLRSKIESYASKSKRNIKDRVNSDDISSILSIVNRHCTNSIEEMIKEDDLINVIKEQSTYIPGIDEIIIVGDRDKGSFKENQYDEVLKLAKSKNIRLIITNPCIEFWFLLHYTDALEIDKSSWTTDDCVADYVIKELKKFDPKYKKKKLISAEYYLNNIDKAIENSKCYTNDLSKLKNNIGTNMPELIELITKMK